MNTDMKLRVTEIQRFCMHDGPGVRTTVFLKGCPLRCAWCHNPEAQKASAELMFYKNKCIMCGGCALLCNSSAHRIDVREIDRQKCISCFACVENCPTGALEMCGKDMSIDQILDVVQKDKAFYGKNGGVTISGGEPFAQREKTVALLEACKEQGISTAVETCGFADPDILRAAASFVDLFLFDVKDTDSLRHKQYTGVSNESILSNLYMLSEMGAKIRLRCILVNGVNTNEAHYLGISRIASQIKNIDGVELIPYHAYSGSKATFIGEADNGREDWIPPAKELQKAREILRANGVCEWNYVAEV